MLVLNIFNNLGFTMNLKIVFIGLISCNLYIFPMAGPTPQVAIPRVPQSVPLTACDKRYSLEMDRAMTAYTNIGNSAARANLMELAEEYMILVKHQQDLDIAIRAIEAKIFNLDNIRALRIPLKNYIKCKDYSDAEVGENGKYSRSFEVNSKVPTVTRLGYPDFVPFGPCDTQYRTDMERMLNDIKLILKVDLLPVAEEYMVLIKQQQDVDLRIRELELRVFSSSVINILRRPVQQYIKCMDSLRTGTFSRNFYH